MLHIYWFRKDLRLEDNNALSEFCKAINPNDKFLFLYIKNKNSFKYFGEKRISFLYESLFELKNNLNKLNLDLNIVGGNSLEVFKKLLKKYGSLNVFTNAQVEPYCIERDKKVEIFLDKHSGKLNTFNDTYLMEFDKIFNNSSQPYTVFTPYKNKFLKLLSEKDYEDKKVNLNLLNKKNQIIPEGFISHDIEKEYMNLDKSSFIKGGRENGTKLLNNFIKNNINNYSNGRDFPALNATSLLSPHLHFGTISIRECFRVISKLKKTDGMEKWRDELIWREFYYYITFNFPFVIDGAFKKIFDNINWNYDKNLFKQWQDGKTGFPIVDAGMRQLKKEGWMHNRVRMITAMFLTKDLLIDWKLGEKYFAENLIDMDFASNNGGWQWSASTGCDAQPYFRIFNPYLQSKKIDAEGLYIKRYVDELKNVPLKYIHNPSEMPLDVQKKCGVIIGKDYPAPVVNHSIASKFTIETFKIINKKFY